VIEAVRLRDLQGRVLELGVEDGTWTGRPTAPLLDATRLWAVPGLVDAHAHLAADRLDLRPGDPTEIAGRAFAALEGGVFLCVDKGWCDRSVLSLLRRPPTERPDLQAAGRMIAVAGGYYEGFAVEVDLDTLTEVVAEEARNAAGWVKLVGDWPRRGRGPVANFDEDALRTAVEVAHRAGARVAIHTMAPEVPTMAVRAGVDSIEHGLFLTDDDVSRLGARGGAWVPTIRRVEELVEVLGADSSGGRLLSEGLSRIPELLPRAVRAGVAVLAGSDLTFPSARVGEEVAALREYGLEPADALAAATTRAYRYLGVAAGFEPGLPADLVGFEVHPWEDPTAPPALVIRRGRVLSGR
jgi:imidazolonepropionase-like amidohydrolase